MQVPVKVAFLNLDASEALEARINEKIAKLDHKFSGLVSCQVTVDSAHHHQHKGRLYSVHIIVTLPGGEIVVNNHIGKNPIKHDKVFTAMNEAFLAVEKQLEKFKELTRRDVKVHTINWLKGEVAKLNDEEGFGFIINAQGEETYFHKNAVQHDSFDDLEVGSKVRYVLAEGEGIKGPQATTVKLAQKK